MQERFEGIFKLDANKNGLEVKVYDRTKEPVGYYPLKMDVNDNMAVGTELRKILKMVHSMPEYDCDSPKFIAHNNTVQGAILQMVAHTVAIAQRQADAPVKLSLGLATFAEYGYDNAIYNDCMTKEPPLTIIDMPANLKEFSNFRTLSEQFKRCVRGIKPVNNGRNKPY